MGIQFYNIICTLYCVFTTPLPSSPCPALLPSGDDHTAFRSRSLFVCLAFQMGVPWTQNCSVWTGRSIEMAQHHMLQMRKPRLEGGGHSHGGVSSWAGGREIRLLGSPQPNFRGTHTARDAPENHPPQETHRSTPVLREKWPKTFPDCFGMAWINYFPSEVECHHS